MALLRPNALAGFAEGKALLIAASHQPGGAQGLAVGGAASPWATGPHPPGASVGPSAWDRWRRGWLRNLLKQAGH